MPGERSKAPPMRKVRSTRVATLGLVFPLLLGGCGGGDDPGATPSPAQTSAAATPAATTQPEATPSEAATTPDAGISPLGGKPATEEEKKYYNDKKAAMDLALARNYQEAIPKLEELVTRQPTDPENYFYLMLCHGWLEDRPSKKSKAYTNAEKVLELSKDLNLSGRARHYIIAAQFEEPPATFKYGINTRTAQNSFVHYPDETYKLTTDTPVHVDLQPRLDPEGQTTLWESAISPDHFKDQVKVVPKGQMVKILGEQAFIYSLTSWRKPVRPKSEKYNDKMFDVSVFYVEVISEGEYKGTKGWIVNHMDRWIDRAGEDPWGEWISNRVDLAHPFKEGEAVVPATPTGASPTPAPEVKPTPQPTVAATPKPTPQATPDDDGDDGDDGPPPEALPD